MPGILIIAHAPLASALKAVGAHAYPDCARQVEALDVRPETAPDVVEAQARELMGKLPGPGALIFTDVFGATPSNVAQRFADHPGVRVITGVNVPMLWRCLCYANESLDDLAQRALAGATQGIMQVANLRPQTQSTRPGANDQDSRHHQQ